MKINRISNLMLVVTISTSLISRVCYASSNSDFPNDDFLCKLNEGSEMIQPCVRLAEKGDIDAAYKLGNRYVKGFGIPKDYPAAIKWLSIASENGHMDAKYLLGIMYGNGWGVKRDYRRAFDIFTEGAVLGISKFQVQLGVMYENGLGIREDKVRAHMWYNIASMDDYDNASFKRDMLENRIGPAGVERAMELMRNCLESHMKKC
jgi:TPR repeat protein